MKHTPGPWRVYTTDLGQFRLAFGIERYVDGNLHAIGHVYRHESDVTKQEQADADARLIAAAPELLDGLTEAIRLLRVLGEGELNPTYIDAFEDIVKKADGRLSI